MPRGRRMPADARTAFALLLIGATGCAEAPSGEPGGYVGSAVCAGCHAREAGLWATSDHARAMTPAPGSGIPGDFSGAFVAGPGFDARFVLRDGNPTVVTQGPDGETGDFRVRLGLGVDPLQQLLLERPDGSLGAFPVAWDSRPDSAGGERWFDLYAEAPPEPGDPLHWTGREQDAQARCIECHVTGFRAEIDPVTCVRTATTWQEGTVACEACHGPGEAHVAWAEQSEGERDGDPRLAFGRGESGAAWMMDAETGIARRDPPRASHAELQTCAPCHSRRTPLVETPSPGLSADDAWRVALLEPGLYWPDGQVRDEVYEHGSFLQSRMHAAGVTCGDCHDPHSGRTFGEGNVLCARCHLPDRFDTPEHTLHAPGSAGAECIACHMPSAVFMGVDVRHDHSLRIPRPDLSAATGAPDACAACHADRPAGWAAAALRDRYGEPDPHPFAEAFRDAADGLPGATPGLVTAAADTSLAGIVRATAVSFLRARDGDGVLALACNPVAGNWAARTPLSILFSRDNGESWPERIDLETDPGEFSYPAIIETEEGLAVSYTWNRRRIAVARITLETERSDHRRAR